MPRGHVLARHLVAVVACAQAIDAGGMPLGVQVDFFSSYVADVMTSSVKTMQDMAWTACFFLSGDFLLEVADYHKSGDSWQVLPCRPCVRRRANVSMARQFRFG